MTLDTSKTLKAALVALALIGLSACSDSGDDSASNSSEAPSSSDVQSSEPSSDSSPDSSSADANDESGDDGTEPSTTANGDTGEGCTDGSGDVPDHAVSQEVVDVDGDGQPDTAWIGTAEGETTFGIATAAGGGTDMNYDSASPIPRSVLVTDVDEQGPVELIVSDGRSASLFAFVDCEVQPVLNQEGETYEFDLQDLRGNGTGIGCIDTEEGQRLVGLQAEERTDTEVTWNRTVVELDGLSAVNGETETGSYSLPDEEEEAELLDEITCGDLTMQDDGLSEEG